MALAPLFNIPKNPAELGVFSLHNQDMHRRIVEEIANSRNVILPLYPIDPLPMNEFSNWLVSHQALHNDFTQVLGIVGSDFSTVDFTNPSELSAWIFLHAAEHAQAADILGLN